MAGFAPSCFATLAVETLVISLHELHKGIGFRVQGSGYMESPLMICPEMSQWMDLNQDFLQGQGVDSHENSDKVETTAIKARVRGGAWAGNGASRPWGRGWA